MNDESLMEYVLKHDHQAFSVLVERRSEMFYASAYRIVMNKEAAEDIVQEAFLKIWSRPNLWNPKKGAKFTTWFYKIVVNQALDWIRQEKKTKSTEIVEDIIQIKPQQESNMIKTQEQEVLDKAIKSLPEKQLLALNLCFYEGLSNKEAAEILEVSVKALESLLMRAKLGVRDYLHREGILKQGDVA